MGLRGHDGAPGLVEIAVVLAVWSIAFEWVGPRCFGTGTSDALDVLAYAAGGLFGWLIWNRRGRV